MTRELVAEANGVTKTYGDGPQAVEALRGVDLSVETGELVAVMGPSGCGKSTLLHLLGGLDRPSAGEVTVGGRRVDTLNESERAVLRREKVGFVFQAFNLVPNLTVAENVELPGLLARRPRHDVAARREELLARLGLGDKERALPGDLSGGEQQRVAIARALSNEPPLLLADEPTGNLDSASGAAVVELIREAHAGGQTVVLVTHDPKVACSAERVVFMRDGRFVEQARLDGAAGGAGGEAAVVAQLVRLDTETRR